MESNNNYVIMVAINWHRVACTAYFVTSNYIYFDENYIVDQRVTYVETFYAARKVMVVL